MPIFRRENEEPSPSTSVHPPSPAPGPARERPVSRIAEGTRISGQVTGSTELLIEGELEGKIDVDARVVIGGSGTVRGEIKARSVLAAGKVFGNVRGRERVEVGASGSLEGDISAPRVTIAEGAFFKGKVEMSGGAPGRGRAGARRDNDSESGGGAR
jgi:cytoskeletal protein CcmA (bactofilin family)